MEEDARGGKSAIKVHYKTGSLQQTDNYIWNTADVLGRGATADVHFARHKHTGELCAAKVFQSGPRQLRVIQQREIANLRALKHNNIVRLLDIEKEQTTGSEVVIMEYCSGGSVQTMLEQPQFGFGFPETEFLVFWLHITLGLRYMGECGYVHRDLKPGNILLYIDDNGQSVYKIADLGSARELPENETFKSIYGTEEYLHPKMYERAVLRDVKPDNQQFNGTVDLWSVAVTIFHVCTGMLPFRPFFGRNDTLTMHKMTSSKPPGCISAEQKEANGVIVWGYMLPNTCQLSRSLQKHICKMLAGLMELNPLDMWSAKSFFTFSEHICSRISLKIFYCKIAETITVYLNRSDTFVHLQESVAELTDLQPNKQLILFKDRDLVEFISTSQEIHTYPRRILKETLFLFSKDLNDTLPVTLTNPGLPVFQEIGSIVDTPKDAQASKKNAAIACYLVNLVSCVLKCQDLLQESDSVFRRYVQGIVLAFQRRLPDVKRIVVETRLRLQTVYGTYQLVYNLQSRCIYMFDAKNLTSKCTTEMREKLKTSLRLLEDTSLLNLMSKIERKFEEIETYVNVLREKLIEQGIAVLTNIGCLSEDHCLEKTGSLKDKILGVAKIMAKHKKFGELHKHEKFIHEAEKAKLQELCVSIRSVFQDHCLANLKRTITVVQKQSDLLAKHLSRTTKVDLNIKAVSDCQMQLSLHLQKVEEDCREITEDLQKYFEDEYVSLSSNECISSSSGSEINSRLRSRGVSDVEVVYDRNNSRKPLLKGLSSGLQRLQEESENLQAQVNENRRILSEFLEEAEDFSIEVVAPESIVCQETHALAE